MRSERYFRDMSYRNLPLFLCREPFAHTNVRWANILSRLDTKSHIERSPNWAWTKIRHSFDPKLLSNISVLTKRIPTIQQFILVIRESHETLSSISFHSEFRVNHVIRSLIKPRARSYFSIWEAQRYLENIRLLAQPEVDALVQNEIICWMNSCAVRRRRISTFKMNMKKRSISPSI